MKSKFIFILLLLSMLLNIFHDFTISDQIKSDLQVKNSLLESDKGSIKVDDLHHFFHFFGIVLSLKNELSLLLQTAPTSITVQPPFLILQTSFKPPKF